jgi:hypothetical protein
MAVIQYVEIGAANQVALYYSSERTMQNEMMGKRLDRPIVYESIDSVVQHAPLVLYRECV